MSKSWRERFDKKCDEFEGWSFAHEYEKTEIKDFISQVEQETFDRCLKCLPEKEKNDGIFNNWWCVKNGFNQAIDQFKQNILKEKEK